MAKNFVQHGNTLTFTVPADGVVSGMVYKIGTLAVIADGTFAEGAECEGHTVGVWDLPKVSSETPTQFAKAYLKADGTVVTNVASGNTLIGVYTEAAANGDLRCTVRLNGTAI